MARAAPCGRGADSGAKTPHPSAASAGQAASAPLCAMDFSPPGAGRVHTRVPHGARARLWGDRAQADGMGRLSRLVRVLVLVLGRWLPRRHYEARGPGPVGKLVCHLQRQGVCCPRPRRVLTSGCVRRHLIQSDCLRVSLPIPNSVCVPELRGSHGGGEGVGDVQAPTAEETGSGGGAAPTRLGRRRPQKCCSSLGLRAPAPSHSEAVLSCVPSTPSPPAGWRRWRPPDWLPHRGAHTTIAGELEGLCSVPPCGQSGLVWSPRTVAAAATSSPHTCEQGRRGPGGSVGAATDSGLRLGS